MPGRVLHVRAGVIVGPHESIGRLPRWLRRMERGGDVLAPGPAEAGMQWIDARDLAEWMLDMAARREARVFNGVAPPGWTTWGAVLEACREAANPAARLAWVDGARVAAALEEPWTQLPIWPAPQPELAHVYDVDTRRARSAGPDPAAGRDRRRHMGVAPRRRRAERLARGTARRGARRGARCWPS